MTEKELELIEILKDLDLMLDKFCIIQNIPEFYENKKNPIWIRFESNDDVYMYISIMRRYRHILDELHYIEYIGENSSREIIYNVNFTKPGWYRGYRYIGAYEKFSNIAEYIYDYDIKFNELIKEMKEI